MLLKNSILLNFRTYGNIRVWKEEKDMFTDKIAVITGEAKGIGKVIKDEFEKSGATVCIIDTKENPYFVEDVGDEGALRAFVDKANENFHYFM